ncbi:MAG TPA: hypothetical protein VJN70_14810, partial [Gemmatimonadaceae bacterium]|nr:hypothetical protein [Gemmatimonadaceae bacterium]
MTALAAKRRASSEYSDGAVTASPLGNRSKRVRSRRFLRASAATLWFSVAAVYLWCPVHRFPAARPFQGNLWYNPYSSITSSSAWQKVNLHAHTRVWGGLTNGHGSADDVERRYRALGYDASPVSNYQVVTRPRDSDSSALTVYEHGFNVRKVHFLAVDPRGVDWLDYPLLQGRDEEQHRIDRLRARSALVILAHPWLRRAVSEPDLRALTGYTAIEIGSSFGRSDDAWNTALDAGRPVWGIANDDAHDFDGPNESGGFWTMIAASSSDAHQLESALIAGRAYAVFGHAGRSDVSLTTLTVVGDTVSVVFGGEPATLMLIASGDRVVGEIVRGHEARWTIPCDAAWVRVVARTATSKLSLQPVLRSQTGALPGVHATIAPTATFVRRMMAVVLLLLALVPWIGRGALRFARSDGLRL